MFTKAGKETIRWDVLKTNRLFFHFTAFFQVADNSVNNHQDAERNT